MSTLTTGQHIWDVTQVVTMEPFNPGAFCAILLCDGRKVATVQNAGNGGCNCYTWLGDRRTRKTDRASLRQAAQQAWPEVDFEVEDHYVASLIDAHEARSRR